MLRSDLSDYSDAYIVVKGNITASARDGAHNRDKKTDFYHLKIMHHLFLAFQKLIIHLLSMQKI